MAKDNKVNNLRLNISNTIAERIVSGIYGENTLLPREIDFCKEFSVGRSSIRESLRILSTCGLIVAISGYGTRVNEYKKWNLLDPKVLQWMSGSAVRKEEFVRYVLDLRSFIEPHVNLLAVENATADDIQALKKEITTMEKSLDDIEKYTQADTNFHCIIFQASGNPLWASFSQFIFSALSDVLSLSNIHSTGDSLETACKRHKILYHAIANGDSKIAEEITQALLEQVRNQFLGS